MWYNYKIQQTFNNLKTFNDFIKLFWARSLDKINLRDSQTNKIIDTYNWFIMYESNYANKETIKYFKKHFDKSCHFIEVLRK